MVDSAFFRTFFIIASSLLSINVCDNELGLRYTGRQLAMDCSYGIILQANTN
jgi:hypothetical protein